jgi:hypothetical protein
MFLSRSVTCIIDNQSACSLRLSTSHQEHGSLDSPIPTAIPAGTKAQFVSSTAGLFTGTEGWVVFEIEGAQAMFEITWNNPFVGDNQFTQTYRLLPDVGESPAGSYVGQDPSGEDLEDADDAVVTYTLVIQPPPPVESGASSSAAQAAAPTPPPDPDAPQEVAAPPGGASQASGVGAPTPPRLAIAINAVEPKDAGEDKSVDAILALIAKRLEGGLDVVWKKGGELGLWDTTKWKDSDPEEKWARAITEQLFGTAYNGAGAAYGLYGAKGDTAFYSAFSDPAKSPVSPLTCACQHLVSFGILGRGFSLAELANQGFSCNDASSMTVFSGGQWSTEKSKKVIAKAVDEGLKPGGVYVCNPEPKSDKQRQGSHIAFVLRVDPTQKVAQFFDTGGLSMPERGGGPIPTIMADFAGKGAYDEPFWDNVTTEYYIGMGVPKAAPALDAEVARIKKTRPIGLARLALVSRGAKFADAIDAKSPPKELLYVSRLLRMYGDTDDKNFTIARYYWSLRDLPGKEEIQAYWLLYVPRDVSVDAKASAEKKAQAKMASAFMSAPRTKKVDEFGTPLARARFIALTSLGNGKVKQAQRLYTKAENNKPGTTGAATSKELLEPADGVPPNLGKLNDALPPSASIAQGTPKLPELFLDYAPPAAPPST